jgi:hypothetical protein
MIFVKINVQNYVAEDFKSNFVDNFLYIYMVDFFVLLYLKVSL